MYLTLEQPSDIYIDSYRSRGVALSHLNRFDEGIADLAIALKLRKDDPTLLYEKGYLEEKAGRKKDAVADLPARGSDLRRQLRPQIRRRNAPRIWMDSAPRPKPTKCAGNWSRRRRNPTSRKRQWADGLHHCEILFPKGQGRRFQYCLSWPAKCWKSATPTDASRRGQAKGLPHQIADSLKAVTGVCTF